MMIVATCLDADKSRLQPLEEGHQLGTFEFAGQDGDTVCVNTVRLKDALGDIQADHCNRRHWVCAAAHDICAAQLVTTSGNGQL
jgi:hypothetical protein